MSENQEMEQTSDSDLMSELKSEGWTPELIKQDRALGEVLESQSQVAKLEFQRRLDEATAVAHVATSVWRSIDENKQRRDALQKSKWWKAVGILFTAGFFIWWLVPDQYSGVGMGLMIVTAVSYFGYWIDLYSLERGRIMLEHRQVDFLCRWLSTGANESNFWSLRDCARNERSLEESPAEEWQKKEQKINERKNHVWLEARRSMLEKVTGMPQHLG